VQANERLEKNSAKGAGGSTFYMDIWGGGARLGDFPNSACTDREVTDSAPNEAPTRDNVQSSDSSLPCEQAHGRGSERQAAWIMLQVSLNEEASSHELGDWILIPWGRFSGLSKSGHASGRLLSLEARTCITEKLKQRPCGV
jgi:hypothetical protein